MATEESKPSAGEDEDAMLAKALAMSMGGPSGEEDVPMQDASEEAQMARAIEMSMNVRFVYSIYCRIKLI